MPRIILLLLLLLANAPPGAHGQRVSDSIAFRDDTPDSAFLHGGVYFDKAGAFLAKHGWTRDERYFLTPQRRYGPYPFIGSESSTNQGSIGYTGSRRDEERSGDSAAWYYWHGSGVRVHGPVRGEMVRFNTEDSREAMSLVVRVRDSLFYYVDGQQVGAGPFDDAVESSATPWCVFSPRGRALYQVPAASGFVLLLDGRRIDSSGVRFYAMSVDDDGRYLYASRIRDDGKPAGGGTMGRGDDGYSYRVVLRSHTGDYGSLDAVETFNVAHNPRFAQGDHRNGDTGYALLDGRLYHGVGQVLEVSLAGKPGVAFTTKEGKGFAVYAHGRRHPLRYGSISHLTTDSAEAFALTGLRDYYRYVVVNGTERPRPLSKHGARGNVLALDARGRALVCYRNDDSTWIYADDSLLLPPVKNRVPFEVVEEYDLLRSYRRAGEPTMYERPAAFRLGDAFYVWYRGTLSPPLPLYADTTGGRREAPGIAVGAAGANEHGFFLFYRTGNGELALNLNNRIFHTFQGIDRAVYGGQWLDADGLTFYAVQGREYHRYSIQP